MTETKFRFFTIADYEDEEIWLRKMHNDGLKLVKVIPLGIYTFEECEPEDVIYRMDFSNNEKDAQFISMAQDFGWEYVEKMLGWLYFRKPAEEADGEEQLFSDDESRADMAAHVVKTRLVPVAIIFLCIVVPNLLNAVNGKMSGLSGFFAAVFGILFVIYVYLIVHCGLKLKAIIEENRK